ncbi:MAG: FAD-dependent oxidoreductase [Phycisphaerae bacterium]|jgi:hypothetical protein|nr:FAD-dependent oxidoreductase [Phycisphaerae bacterium]
MDDDVQLIVAGGGSAGTMAALSAARFGIQTILIERESQLGGTSTVAGVNCWEPAVGATGLPYEFYQRMREIPEAVGIYSLGRYGSNSPIPFPGAENILDPRFTYADTLRRYGLKGISIEIDKYRQQLHGVIFEPDVWHRTAVQMLKETGCCSVWLNKEIKDVRRKNDKTIEAALNDGSHVAARRWIDTTGLVACRLGARCFLGNNPQNPYLEGEPAGLNGVTRIFRISPVDVPRIEPLADDIPEQCWWQKDFPAMVCTLYPNGDRHCNMLPTFEGNEFMAMPPEIADREGLRRVASYWHFLQTHYTEFQHYRLAKIFPRSGIRETFQVECEYMLKTEDLLLGCRRQSHSDIIALADHARDTHGRGKSHCTELAWPYGIPYRCLLPKGCPDLLIAGRIAGFSKAAASSCRLARTMMMLGEAAGIATALAVEHKCGFPDVDVRALRDLLRRQRVTLESDMESSL